jgi:hypothetical protein
MDSASDIDFVTSGRRRCERLNTPSVTVERSRKPKIGDLQVPTAIEQDIGTLHVSVHYFIVMDVVKAREKLLGNAQNLPIHDTCQT